MIQLLLKHYGVPQQIKHRLTYDPATSLVDIYQMKLKAGT
jgi:hypothetical protein